MMAMSGARLARKARTDSRLMPLDSNAPPRSHVQRAHRFLWRTTMRTILLAAALTAAGGLAQAQNPTNRLPNQAELPSPSTSLTPNAGNDEVAARRKLEDQGYRDLRNVTPNGDGTFSARGVRQDPPGMRRPGSNPEINVEIDASGNVRER
jgi:hypothetical protein